MIAGFGAYFEQEIGISRFVGSGILAIISAAIAYIISFLLLHLLRRKTQQQ